MNPIWFPIYMVGFFVFVKAAQFVLVTKALLGARYKRATGEIRSRSELPSYLETLFGIQQERVLELGFEFSHCMLMDGIAAGPNSKRWNLIYFHPETRCYAEIVATALPDAHNPASVAFLSVFEKNFTLVTWNGTMCEILGQIPDTLMVDALCETVEGHYECHLEELRELLPEKQPIVLSPASYLALDLRTGNAYLEGLRQDGLVKMTADGTLQYSLKAACLQAAKGHQSAKAYRQLNAKRQKLAAESQVPPVEIPIEAEVEAFMHIREASKGAKSGFAGKAMAFVASLLIFSLVFGFSLSFAVLGLLVGVLLVHELGHYFGMVLFGFRDRQILFLPIGAATMGSSRQASAIQRVIVYLLGPAPGIAIGACLTIIYMETRIDIVGQSAGLFMVLNYLNLLPIVPLDGGRVFELVLFSRVWFLKSAFSILSTGLFIIGGILLRDPILLTISAFSLIGLRAQLRQHRMLSEFRKTIREDGLDTSDEVLLPAIFRMFKHGPYSNVPFAVKSGAAKGLLENATQRPPTVWTTVLSLILYALVICLPLLMIVCYLLIARFQSPG